MNGTQNMKQTKDAKRLMEEGIMLRMKGDYREAGKRFDLAAELGSAEALYLAGENIKDILRGRRITVCSAYDIMLEDAEYRQFDYFYRSAENGYAPAMLRIADIYRTGGALFDANPPKAVYWYTRALRNGMEEARERLADCYAEGYGVDKNAETAEKIRSGASNF